MGKKRRRRSRCATAQQFWNFLNKTRDSSMKLYFNLTEQLFLQWTSNKELSKSAKDLDLVS